MKYAIIDDATQVVQNVIVWDGVTPFASPAETTLVNIDDFFCGPGWIQQPNGSYAPPVDESLDS